MGVEFKGKIMSKYSMVVEWHQGVAAGIVFWKFSFILELGMRNRYISKTALKKMREKNSEFSTSLTDSQEENL